MYNIVTVTFKDSNTATANGVRQWDYGQILRIQGLQLPTAVEVHFALIDSKDSVTRIGTTKDGVTDVVIPDSMIEAGKNIFAYVYLRDSESGQTEYEIKIVVTTRAKPEAFDTPEDKELFAQAIEAVNEAADRTEESEQAAAGHRTAVEEMKNSVEQTASTFPQKVQEGVQAIENAGASEVQEITQAGTAQKTAVEAAGTQAVESVENVQQVATEAVETAKTEAVQAVQAEGAKQIKEVQDKGAEVLQSIPEDFTTQMETKLDKQQGIENKGKALVIGEDGNVVPGEVASGGGDGIAIINTMSGESPLVIPDSAERVNKRLELGGKTEQVQTTGVNLFDEKLLLDFDSENYDKTQSGSGFYYYKFPVSGTVTVSTKNANKNGEYLTVGIKPDGSDKTWLSHGTAAISKYKTLTPEDGNIYLGVNNNLERVKSMIQNTGGIIINKCSVAKPYEPYTGGKPSPSLEYEQEVKNAGKWNEGTQKYEVDVKVVGKNLFDVNYFAESENYQNKEGDATYWKYATFKVKPNTTYTVSKRKSLNVNGAINNGIYYGGALAFNNDVNSVKITTKDDGVFYVIFFYRSEDVNILKEMDIQIELGETLTEYEPYKEQTLTLTSDRPITKWDKLVEQGGQIGWLYQSSKMILDGTKIKWLHSNKPENSYFATTIIDAYGGKGASFCKTYRNIQDSAYVIKYANERCIYSDHPTYTSGDKFFRAPNENVTTLEQWKEFIDENPIEMLYHTKNSEFVPLPQSEQNAIRALKAYYPTTVITADGGELDPDIKVTYTADTKNYIDGKVSAKVASILRQYQADTANLLSLMPMETQATMIENDTNNILNNLESEEAHE